MQNLKAQCLCGRQMVPLRTSPGTLRCPGCGSRVTIGFTPDGCMQPVGVAGGWQVCGGEVHSRIPSPICLEHLERREPSAPEFVEIEVPRPRLPPPDGPRYVYFARLDNRVKIGYSVDPKRRMKGLSLHDQAELVYVCRGGRSLEKQLHYLFAERRIAGEWFEWCPEIEGWIAQRKGTDLTYTPMKHTMSSVGVLHPENPAPSPAEEEPPVGPSHERGTQ